MEQTHHYGIDAARDRTCDLFDHSVVSGDSTSPAAFTRSGVERQATPTSGRGRWKNRLNASILLPPSIA
jgi:hypothetical protein